MAKYPIRITLSPSKPSAPKPTVKPVAKPVAKPMAKPAQNRAAPLVTQGRLDRNARMQGEEARSEAMLLKRGRPDVIRTTVAERMTPTKKNK
jgi:hypothetical protein